MFRFLGPAWWGFKEEFETFFCIENIRVSFCGRRSRAACSLAIPVTKPEDLVMIKIH